MCFVHGSICRLAVIGRNTWVMIPQKTVEQILDTARIEEVVGDFVTLKRRGANFIACCPFHHEKTPSFYVSPAKGVYKCFGCGKGGSAIGFVMEHEHFSYVEALKYLAGKYNIEVEEKEETAEEIAARQRTESLILVSDFAAKFFASQLKTTEGRTTGYAYLRSRGVDDETMGNFGLGWAPSGRSSFTDAALAVGYKEEYLLEAGLSIRYDDGRLADRFHERAMFPIHSLSGRVLAFSGRTLRSDGSVAKYVNSPETPIYVKSRALYGIYLAKGEISRMDKCYLVEGNVDVVSMHQIGIRNVTASCGTALTEEQIRIIHKFTENVTVMYDGDAAGIHAALRAIGMILKEGMNVKLLLFPDGDDPDSFVRKHTLAEVEDFIAENEQDFISYMETVMPEAKRDPLKRSELINQVAVAISMISDIVKRMVFIESASSHFSLEQSVLAQRVRELQQRQWDEELKSRERRQRREAAGLNPELPEEGTELQVSETAADVLENKLLAPVEQDLLYFILRYGTSELDFQSDSDFYSGNENDKPTVADFIREALEADDCRFANSLYRKTYDAYMAQYDQGLLQDEIIQVLLNAPDRDVAHTTAALYIEKHQLTVDNFRNSLTTTQSWLVNFVPKTILIYGDKRLENKLLELRSELRGASSDHQVELMRQIQSLMDVQKKIKTKLGR